MTVTYFLYTMGSIMMFGKEEGRDLSRQKDHGQIRETATWDSKLVHLWYEIKYDAEVREACSHIAGHTQHPHP